MDRGGVSVTEAQPKSPSCARGGQMGLPGLQALLFGDVLLLGGLKVCLGHRFPVGLKSRAVLRVLSGFGLFQGRG